MVGSVAWRAALLLGVGLSVSAVALGAALPRSFFVDFGWAAGPAVWAGCAALTARALVLPLVPALAGAAVAGLPSLVAVLVGVHWLGAPLGVALFAAWCGRLATGRVPGRRSVPAIG